MKLPYSTLKWFPLLLIISIFILFIDNKLRQQTQEDSPAPGLTSMDMEKDGHDHSQDGEADPHDDPEKNRLMGNFHNNEGIKAASRQQWEEAIKNFKMALHHTKVTAKTLDSRHNSSAILEKPDKGRKVETSIAQGLQKTAEKALINMSTSYLKLQIYEETLKTLKELETLSPDHPLLHYNLACYHSLRGEIPASLQELKKTIELGYQDFTSLQNDPDLDNLRQDESFKLWWETLEQNKTK